MATQKVKNNPNRYKKKKITLQPPAPATTLRLELPFPLIDRPQHPQNLKTNINSPPPITFKKIKQKLIISLIIRTLINIPITFI